MNGVAGASLKEALGMQHTAVLGAQHVVVDAASTTDLQTLAQAWPHHPEWLLVGSAGLARQIAGGAWTSKLGGLEDIRHVEVAGVAGSEYGAAVTFLKRKKPAIA